MLFSIGVFAQGGGQPASKIGWIDTGFFADEKEGVTKYINALKALDTELKPRITELQNISKRIETIAEEIRTLSAPGSTVPVNQQNIATKQDEGQRLQREFEFKKKDYDAVFEKRSGEVLGPVSADISKAIQEFARQKGYAVILDIAALANNGAILALDSGANITKEFVTFYNSRPPTTATTTNPR